MNEFDTDYDVVVIGSGFGGSVSAATLVDVGHKVLMLERGPWRDTEPVRDAGIQNRSQFPRKLGLYTRSISRIAAPFTKAAGIKVNTCGLFDIHINPDMTVISSNGVGGGSHIYSAMNVKPENDDFWDGHVDGVTQKMMDPHYDWMISKMGAKVPSQQERLPNSVFKQFNDSKNFIADPIEKQPAMSIDLNDEPENYENNSFLGCINGSKATLDNVLLIPALGKGLTILALHECTAIYKQDSGKYLLEILDLSSNKRKYLKANKVVLAAGTLNTLKLLLRSQQLGGLYGMPSLGHGFGGNGDSAGYWALNNKNADYSLGTPCHGSFSLKDQQSQITETGSSLTCYGFNGINEISVPSILKRKLKTNQFVVGMGIDKADGVVILKNGKLRIKYIRQNSSIFSRIYNSFNSIAKRSEKTVYYMKDFLLTVHPLGGARLSDSPETGVVKANGEVFEHSGLYISDAASLPAAPGTPPSMTIAAWARHVALGISDTINNTNRDK